MYLDVCNIMHYVSPEKTMHGDVGTRYEVTASRLKELKKFLNMKRVGASQV